MSSASLFLLAFRRDGGGGVVEGGGGSFHFPSSTNPPGQ